MIRLFDYIELIPYSRNMRVLFAMMLMDTNLPQNAKLAAILKKRVASSSLLEVFLESAPQFILQSYIIIKTGNTSKYFKLPKNK